VNTAGVELCKINDNRLIDQKLQQYKSQDKATKGDILDSNVNFVQHVFIEIIAAINLRQVALEIL